MSNQAEYSFTTAEGDEVTISLSDARSKGQAASYAQNGDNYGLAVSEQSSEEVSFSISVNGELNKEEQKNHSLFNDENFIKRVLNNVPIEMREFLDEIKKLKIFPVFVSDSFSQTKNKNMNR